MEYPSFTQTYHTSSYAAISPDLPALSASGKVIFITGGSVGIGLAVARAFAAAKARAIIISGRRASKLESAAAELRKLSTATEIATKVLDVTEISASKAALNEAVAKYGGVDVLVANAGTLPGPAPLADIGPEEFWRGFETNVKGLLGVTQAFALHAEEAVKQGKEPKTLINTSSAAGHGPYIPGNGAYGATKIATIRWMEHLQVEHSSSLRVFSIHPGVYRTEIVEKLPQEFLDNFKFDEIDLAGNFCVWLAAPKEADFLKGRFVWANWDVDELKKDAQEIQEKDLLNMRLEGFTKNGYTTKM